MIKRLVVEKLYDRFDFDLHFNEDLNLLTGRNGSGKTTLMKLMWGILSGRMIMNEDFPKLHFVDLEVSEGRFFQGTRTKYSQVFTNLPKEGPEFVAGWNFHNQNSAAVCWNSVPVVFDRLTHDTVTPKELVARSLFFPTFRRGEAGFGFLDVDQNITRQPKTEDDIRKILHDTKMEASYNCFVNTTSTYDIDYLIQDLHWSISNQLSNVDQVLNEYISALIAQTEVDSNEILKQIKAAQIEANDHRIEIKKPLDFLYKSISLIFQKKSLKFSSDLVIGESNEKIETKHLSSGEKQMLSFLAYCSICKNTIIFIDEPELSLSVDWQRLLVPMLLDIPNGNQYFMATHSPMIYSLYPDKDIFLDSDKGGN